MAARAFKQINAPGLTESGKEWLTWALDPFHDDVSTRIEGMPDQSGHATIIRTYNDYKTINAPADVADGEKWAMLVFTLPIQDLSAAIMGVRDIQGPIDATNADGAIQIGTINIWTWNQTDHAGPFQAWQANALTVDVITGFKENAASDISLTRIIAGGYEVCNDTAELYKDGHVISWSTPTNRERDYAHYTLNSASVGDYPLFMIRSIPISENEAKAVKGCTSWKAAEGCYNPFRINIDNPFSTTTYIPLYFESSRLEDYNMYVYPTNAPNAPFSGQAIKFCNMDNVGTWFSGLNKNTSLTLNTRIIAEVAPVTNLSLLSYNPTFSPSDPMAINLYRECLKSLPVSVTYDENGSAEFWSKALGVISKIATPIGVMLGQPGIGAGVSAVSAAASKALEKKVEKKINDKVKLATERIDRKGKTVEKKITASPQRGKPKRK